MAEDPIKIPVEAEGTEEAAEGLDKVSEGLGKMGQAADGAASSGDKLRQSQERAVQQYSQFTQRVAAASAAVQGLAAAFGTSGATAGLIGRISQSSAAMVQLGATFGPTGAVVGGIVGALIPALQALIGAQNDAAEAAARHRQAIGQLAQSMQQAQVAGREQAALRMGRGEDISGDRLDTMRSEAVAGVTQASADRAAATTREELRIAQQRQANARDQLERIDMEIARREQLGQLLAEEDAAERQRADRRRVELDEKNEILDAEENAARIAARREAAAQEAESRRAQQRRDELDFQHELADIISEVNDLERERNELIIASSAKDIERLNGIRAGEETARQASIDRMEAAQEANERLIDSNRELSESARENAQGYLEATGVIVGGITDALASIVTGQKTAEQAFKGLLASFLKWISEKAGLEALAEAAEAIGSFARYDYASGAQHIAAAVAWGAVAVAAGVGSAAVSASAAPKAAAGPSAGQSSSDGDRKGGDIVINYNSPVVTAGTRAELGREMTQLIGSAQAAYG